MKPKFFLFAFLLSVFSSGLFAQDKTTVTATNTDISDNLDLKAVASIFGDSKDLADFERRLNDPKTQISNLDLNNDNQVDYLRVVESVESNTHVIIIQAVLDKDVYQDIATVEVEKGADNAVQVQVVGDTYMYGDNYIYEPVYVSRPIIYDYFWVSNYHPYYSSWYWGYYPSYYYYWAPYPVYRYRHHVHSYINVSNHYNYVTVRRNPRAVALAHNYRGNGYEVRNPNHSFRDRNATANNRHDLELVRNVNTRTNTRSAAGSVRNNATPRAATGTRNQSAGVRTQTSGTRNGTHPRSNSGTRSVTSPRTITTQTPRTRSQSVTTETPRSNPNVRSETNAAPRVQPTRTESPRIESPRTESPRVQAPRVETPRVSAPQPRVSAPSGNLQAGQRDGGGRR